MKPSHEILDDIYSSSEQEQEALQVLSSEVQPVGGFVWTGRPRAAVDYYSRNFTRIVEDLPWGMLLSSAVFLLYFSVNFEGGFTTLLKLIVLGLVLTPLSLLAWIEYDRRKTYYGVAEGKIWVKTSKGKIDTHLISQLPRLNRQESTIYYSTIVDNTYTKHALLQNIPRAAMVYELLEDTLHKNLS